MRLVQLVLKYVFCKLNNGTKPGAADVRQKKTCSCTRFPSRSESKTPYYISPLYFITSPSKIKPFVLDNFHVCFTFVSK